MSIKTKIASFTRLVVRICVIFCGILAIKYLGNFGFYLYEQGYVDKLMESRIVTKIIEVPEQQQLSKEDLITEFAKAGCPSIVGEVLLENEDPKRYRNNAKRCEWDSKEWLKIATKLEPKDEEQRDALRCSYGAFQVAGWWSRSFGKDWNDLLYPRVNARLACEIMKENFNKAKTAKTLEQRYWLAFRTYNGSGEKAEAYADKSMAYIKGKAAEQMLLSQGFAPLDPIEPHANTHVNTMSERERRYAEKIVKGVPISLQEEKEMLAELESRDR